MKSIKRYFLTSHNRPFWLVSLFLAMTILPGILLFYLMDQSLKKENELVQEKIVMDARTQVQKIQKNFQKFIFSSAVKLSEAPLHKLNCDGLIIVKNNRIVFPVQAEKQNIPQSLKYLEEDENNGFFEKAAAGYKKIMQYEKNPDIFSISFEGQIRNHFLAGNKRNALIELRRHLEDPRLEKGRNIYGNFSYPHLAAIYLINAEDKKNVFSQKLLSNLKTFLHDNSQSMPTAQKVTIEKELLKIGLLQENEISEKYSNSLMLMENYDFENGLLRNMNGVIVKSANSISYFKKLTLIDFIEDQNTHLPEFISLELTPPEKNSFNVLQFYPAAKTLPGWRLALKAKNINIVSSELADKRQLYTWIGAAAICIIIIFSFLFLKYQRENLQLANLKNDLVANVAHELKTPLASTRAILETMQDNELPEEKIKQYIDVMAQENLRLSKLVNNFLTFSKLENKRHQFRFARVHVNEIILLLKSNVESRLPGDLKLTVINESHDVNLKVDPDGIVIALINMIENAYKFSEKGKEIILKVYGKSKVCFEVTDSGKGMSRSQIKNIFRRFYQADQSLVKNEQGCGLGLSIVYHIMEAHGTAVDIKSEPGKGSTFSFTLTSTGATM